MSARCLSPDCERQVVARSRCKTHYYAARRSGEIAKRPPQRVWDFFAIGQPDECWPWRGRTTEKGYGVLNRTRAHRLVYQIFKGEIGEGLVVRHVCDNPPCCNPAHLLLGTPAENTHDMMERGRFKPIPSRWAS